MIARNVLYLLASALLALVWSTILAAAPPDIVLTPIATGAGQPVMLAEPDDGSGRLFVVDRQGSIRIIDHGQLLPTHYLDISVPTTSEQGLVGMAFDPDFASNGIFYLTFTAPNAEPRLGAMQDQVLARFTAANPAANVFGGSVQQGSAARTDVLRVPDLYNNHNGGDIHFGPDGYLYWGMGDGGSAGDPNNFAQNLWKKQVPAGGSNPYYYLLGKMIRIDVRNGTSVATSETCGAAAGTTLQYKIPADNPFVGSSNTCDEIYYLGLRNPWRFSFDRDTSEIYIADVGQDAWEEVDLLAPGFPGRNFGWHCYEGHAGYTPGDCSPTTPHLVGPVFDYSHTYGCSITGGYIYRGPDAPLYGVYVYGDFCSNNLFYADADAGHWHDGAAGITGAPLDTGLNMGSSPVGFGEDLDGNVYVTLNNGTIFRIDSDALFANGFE